MADVWKSDDKNKNVKVREDDNPEIEIVKKEKKNTLLHEIETSSFSTVVGTAAPIGIFVWAFAKVLSNISTSNREEEKSFLPSFCCAENVLSASAFGFGLIQGGSTMVTEVLLRNHPPQEVMTKEEFYTSVTIRTCCSSVLTHGYWWTIMTFPDQVEFLAPVFIPASFLLSLFGRRIGLCLDARFNLTKKLLRKFGRKEFKSKAVLVSKKWDLLEMGVFFGCAVTSAAYVYVWWKQR